MTWRPGRDDSWCDERARSAARDLDESEARVRLYEIARCSDVFVTALRHQLASMGHCSTHLYNERREWLTDALELRLMRCIIGMPDAAPILDVAQIADGVRLTTWLRKITYQTLTRLATDRIRLERTKRQVKILPADPHDLPDTAAAPPTRLSPRSQQLWERYCETSPVMHGSSATLAQAWYLAEVMGLPQLEHVRGHDHLVKDLDVAVVRRRLQQMLAGRPLAADALSAALSTMTGGHTHAQVRDLARADDLVLGHLVRAALTPIPPLDRTALSAVRKAATLYAYAGRPVPSSRPTRIRNLRTVVMAWDAMRAEAGADGSVKSAKTRADDRRAWLDAVDVMHQHTPGELGPNADSVHRFCERVLAEWLRHGGSHDIEIE